MAYSRGIALSLAGIFSPVKHDYFYNTDYYKSFDEISHRFYENMTGCSPQTVHSSDRLTRDEMKYPLNLPQNDELCKALHLKPSLATLQDDDENKSISAMLRSLVILSKKKLGEYKNPKAASGGVRAVEGGDCGTD